MPGPRIWLIVLISAALTLVACGSTARPTAKSNAAVTSSSAAPSTPELSSAIPTPPEGPAVTAAPPIARSAPTQSVGPTSTSALPVTPAGQTLPLSYSTGSAAQVITVVASNTSSTVATLQRWTKSASGWTAVGAAIAARLGAAGMSTSPSESKSATPMGSFTLTQAFGHNANPGAKLPYLQTTPDDWWISQAGPLYNTHQRCASGCAFVQGDPNEHLFYTTPYYNYAVVIDYNTGPVTQGAGSAIFLHVSDGGPTAGCVSIPQTSLVSIMGWLDPAASPRILIGTA